MLIDPDITRARTLPGRFYTDVEIHRRIVEQVFARSWQMVADADRLPEPGFVLPLTLLAGSLDEPLVLTRDRAGELHCLSNVCTHRANLVARKSGRYGHLRCNYHGRCFELDGDYRSMPGFEGAKDFPAPSDDLPRLPLETWGKLLFTSLGATVPFDEWLGPVQARIPWFPIDTLRLDAARSRDYRVASNWALYCDNYLEGFHVPYVHPGLSETLVPEAYRTELFDWGSLQVGIAAEGETRFDLPADAVNAGEDVAAYYFWLFPNLMLNFYPWGLSVNVVQPQGVGRCRVSFLTYLWREDQLDKGAGRALDQVEAEDEAVVEAVEAGVRSRLYKQGRYSPSWERGVHHFHRLLIGALE